MYALTIKQPWASALVHGLKRIENRTWHTLYRGDIAIHAGARPAFGVHPTLPLGAVVGIVRLIDVVPVDQVAGVDRIFASGPFCWLFAMPRPFDEPIIVKGAQGLWRWEDRCSSLQSAS